MLHSLWRKLRRSVRNWGNDPTRADRNAVIQRVVAAAAEEANNKASAPLGMSIPRTPTPPPSASPLPAATPTPAPTSPAPVREPEPLEIPREVVGQRAFEIWIRNGRPAGSATKDWQQALEELQAERRKSS
ncbi:hypothetical protein BH11PLA2_BH11PLA2_09050 [soil metagenome]